MCTLTQLYRNVHFEVAHNFVDRKYTKFFKKERKYFTEH